MPSPIAAIKAHTEMTAPNSLPLQCAGMQVRIIFHKLRFIHGGFTLVAQIIEII